MNNLTSTPCQDLCEPMHALHCPAKNSTAHRCLLSTTYQVIAELEARSKQVAFESHALTAAREQLVALDAQRREAALAVEEALATAGAQLGDAAKVERLRQIRLVEEAYQVGAVGGPHTAESVLGLPAQSLLFLVDAACMLALPPEHGHRYSTVTCAAAAAVHQPPFTCPLPTTRKPCPASRRSGALSWHRSRRRRSGGAASWPSPSRGCRRRRTSGWGGGGGSRSGQQRE
jgi:hypothetical protein